jgi:hypothetical protein
MCLDGLKVTWRSRHVAGIAPVTASRHTHSDPENASLAIVRQPYDSKITFILLRLQIEASTVETESSAFGTVSVVGAIVALILIHLRTGRR